MRPLSLDDLLPIHEFTARRREFFDSHQRYVDRYRRVRLGPRLTLLFENRQTLWFRVQELLRIARLAEPRLVQRELDLWNRLLPGRNQLQAALLIAVEDETRVLEELAAWKDLSGDAVRLQVGPRALAARLVTCRPEDRSIGTAHWVRFPFDAEGRLLFADFRQTARFEIDCSSYRHQGERLSPDVRQSLLDDLELSDRNSDAA
jgi:hypothetical protein